MPKAHYSRLQLGLLVRLHRETRGISQLSLCRLIGWQDASRLSRLESGQGPRPSRDDTDRLIGALGLSWEDRGSLLLAGEYLPEEYEVQQALAVATTFWEDFRHPSYLADYTGRVIDCNDLDFALLGLSPDQISALRKRRPNRLELYFDARHGTRQRLPASEAHTLARQMVAAFKMQHRARSEEPWYQDLVARLSDIDEFRRAWSFTPAAHAIKTLANHLDFSLELQPRNRDSRLDLQAFVTPLATDLRFHLAHIFPKPQSRARFEEFINSTLARAQQRTLAPAR